MAEKKFLDYDGLQEYNTKLKSKALLKYASENGNYKADAPIKMGDTTYSDGSIIVDGASEQADILFPQKSGTLALLEDETPGTIASHGGTDYNKVKLLDTYEDLTEITSLNNEKYLIPGEYTLKISGTCTGAPSFNEITSSIRSNGKYIYLKVYAPNDGTAYSANNPQRICQELYVLGGSSSIWGSTYDTEFGGLSYRRFVRRSSSTGYAYGSWYAVNGFGTATLSSTSVTQLLTADNTKTLSYTHTLSFTKLNGHIFLRYLIDVWKDSAVCYNYCIKQSSTTLIGTTSAPTGNLCMGYTDAKSDSSQREILVPIQPKYSSGTNISIGITISTNANAYLKLYYLGYMVL